MVPKESRPKIVPNAYVLLSNWRYVEESLLRIIAGWGRCAGDWEDKLAVCYHVWLQAEIVQMLRDRMQMFPGGKPDAPVNGVLQRVMDQVIVAPSWNDAMAGVHALVNPALCRTYEHYILTVHPVHDLPTVDLLHRVLELKKKQQEWYAGFVARHPSLADTGYINRVGAGLHEVNHFSTPIESVPPFAEPCGKQTSFAMPKTPGRVKNWNKAPNIMPMIELDWSNSVEARRLYFMIGYCWEMGVAEQQLRWIYHAEFMPWSFVHAEARHMWDESRHGDSGYHRLRDFGLDFEHFGYSSYGAEGEGVIDPMTPRDVYEAFYSITQVAETGYFETKRYCFDDFLTARDDASAEMMQFDIIDETSHVEYGRIWIEELGRRAGVVEDYRKRGTVDRLAARQKAVQRLEKCRSMLAAQTPVIADHYSDERGNLGSSITPSALRDPIAWKHYQWMLSELRGQSPLANAVDAPVRPFLPM